ncbi:hypothetical protein [Frondihabitans australicus]|uniref:Uncharacterized protein n=1 Tax=Frondihabitans australicus TaxID=386892 RepID=A0A495II46_9MICO|nr:hypothetical protein [Frondihabitans australicus]RKR74776.1 hypothetical protein C8E83_1905 [Frondihabitans australicus]
MSRIDIVYDGRAYSLAGVDLEELEGRILSASNGGPAVGLRVNEGEGTVRGVDLLINANTGVSLAAISTD